MVVSLLLQIGMALRAAPPLRPDREEAQRWARDELGKSQYHRDSYEDRPGSGQGIDGGDGGGDNIDPGQPPQAPDVPQTPPKPQPQPISIDIPVWVWWLLGAIAVAALAWLLYHMWRNGNFTRRGKKKKDTATDEDQAPADQRTSAQLRSSADEAARAGDWQRAIIERFRAMVQDVERHRVIAAEPGRTSREVVHDAGIRRAALEGPLAAAADRFDPTKYGYYPATQRDDEQMRGLEKQLADLLSRSERRDPIAPPLPASAQDAHPTDPATGGSA